jgi:drug/metabolite transporter (DMT)-like permease
MTTSIAHFNHDAEARKSLIESQLRRSLLEKPTQVKESETKFAVIIALMNASLIMFTITNALSKEVMSRQGDFATLNEFIFVIMWIIAFASYMCLLKLKLKVFQVPTELKGILFARCFMGGLDYLTTFVAV